ncbi:hypothetical protein M758_UG162500 [Ceratodon purpureus]|nr:hypothetical protein M758_UG162500 [Ceratodon purpureus]
MLWDWNLPLPSIISSLAKFVVEESVKAKLSRNCASSAQPALLHFRRTISSHFDRLIFFWSLVGQRNAGSDGVQASSLDFEAELQAMLLYHSSLSSLVLLILICDLFDEVYRAAATPSMLRWICYGGRFDL